MAVWALQGRPSRRAAFAAMLVGIVLVYAASVMPPAYATKPDPEHKVTLCHSTASRTNPYVVITVDIASVLQEGHDGHTGPIFSPSLPQHADWGDIIPPFDQGPGQAYPGKNWTAEGQAILENGCELPGPTTTTTAPTSTTAGPTTTTAPSTTTTGGPTTTTAGPTTTTAPGSTTTAPETTTTGAPTTTLAPTTTTAAPTTTTAPETTTTAAPTTTLAPSSTVAPSTTTVPDSTTTSTLQQQGTTVPTSSTSTLGPAGTTTTTRTTPIVTTATNPPRRPLPVTGAFAIPLLVVGLGLVGGGLAMLLARRYGTAAWLPSAPPRSDRGTFEH